MYGWDSYLVEPNLADMCSRDSNPLGLGNGHKKVGKVTHQYKDYVQLNSTQNMLQLGIAIVTYHN